MNNRSELVNTLMVTHSLYRDIIPRVYNSDPFDKEVLAQIIKSKGMTKLDKQSFRIFFSEEYTAYTDLKDIYLPSSFLFWGTIKGFLEKIFIEDDDNIDKFGIDDFNIELKLISLYIIMNAFLIHESLHIKYTPEELGVYCQEKGSLFHIIANIIEDIRIERKFYSNENGSNTSHDKTIRSKHMTFLNRLIFPIDSFHEEIKKDHWTKENIHMLFFQFMTNLKNNKNENNEMAPSGSKTYKETIVDELKRKLVEVLDIDAKFCGKHFHNFLLNAERAYQRSNISEDSYELEMYKYNLNQCYESFLELFKHQVQENQKGEGNGDGAKSNGSSDENSSKSYSECEQGDGIESDNSIDIKQLEKELKELIEKIGKEYADQIDFKQMSDKIREMGSKELQELNQMVNKLQDIENVLERDDDNVENFDGLPVVVDINEAEVNINDYYKAKIEIDNDFANFSNYIKHESSPKKETSPPLNSGVKINSRRLHRLITDGKSFINKVTTKRKPQKPQVIFLIDTSGSTWGDNLIGKELGAVLPTFKSFVENNYDVSVWGHTTTELNDGNGAYLISIACYNMPDAYRRIQKLPMHVYEQKFDKFSYIDKNENCDGQAILEVSNYFKNDNREKVIFHLSDGLPSGYGYYGTQSIERTIEEIKETRKKGVKVISLSVVQGVVSNNNKIYGEGDNIEAYGDFLQEELKNIAKRIMIQGRNQ